MIREETAMRLYVDTSKVTFMVNKPSEPKNDQDGKQRHRKEDGRPMWTVQVTALDETGGEVIAITVAGEKPEFTVGQMVNPVGLQAIPWSTNGRSGVAWRADEVQLAG
jgi:hypothetical protein